MRVKHSRFLLLGLFFCAVANLWTPLFAADVSPADRQTKSGLESFQRGDFEQAALNWTELLSYTSAQARYGVSPKRWFTYHRPTKLWVDTRKPGKISVSSQPSRKSRRSYTSSLCPRCARKSLHRHRSSRNGPQKFERGASDRKRSEQSGSFGHDPQQFGKHASGAKKIPRSGRRL